MRIFRLLRLVAVPLILLIVAVVWYSMQLETLSRRRADLEAAQLERNERLKQQEMARASERSRALDLLAKCVFLIEQIKLDSEYAEAASEGKETLRPRQFDLEKREQFLLHFEEELQLWCVDFKPEFKTKNLNNIANLVTIHNELQNKYAFSDEERIEASVKVREVVAEAAGVPPLPKDEQERRELLADAREAAAAEDYDLAEHYLRALRERNTGDPANQALARTLEKEIAASREETNVPLKQALTNQHKAMLAAMDTMLQLKTNGRLQCAVLTEAFNKSVPRNVWFYDYKITSVPPHTPGSTRFEAVIRTFILGDTPLASCSKSSEFVVALLHQFGHQSTEHLDRDGDTKFEPGFNGAIGATFGRPECPEVLCMEAPQPVTLTPEQRSALPSGLPNGLGISYTLSFEIPAEATVGAKP